MESLRSAERERAAELAEEAAAKNGDALVVKKKGGPRVLMTAEERAQGGLSWRTWWYYGNSDSFGGIPWILVILTSIAMQMGVRIFNDYWLSGWTDDMYHRSNYFYIAVYGALGAAQCIALLINVMMMVQRGYVAARKIP